MSHTSVAKLLLDHGANTTIRSLEGNTAFDIAIMHNNSKVIEVLEMT